MANSPKIKADSKSKGKPKAPASAAKKSAPRSGTTPASRTRAKLTGPAQNYVVLGTVTYPDGKPAAGLTVIAFDKDQSRTDTLGNPAVTSEMGSFSIPYSEADFRKTERERGGADVIVYVYRHANGKQELLFTSKKKNNAPEKYELKITVPAEPFVVRGKVTDANQKPLVNVFIRAYERDLRIPQLLGVAETGDTGQFRIAYSPADFQFADAPVRRAPWLIVEVRAAKEGEVLASQDIPKANPDQTVLFTLSRIGALSEKQRCDEEVSPLLRGQGAPRIAGGARAGAENRRSDLAPWDITAADVAFIVRDIQLDRAAIEAWAASSRMARDAGLRLTDEHAEQQALLRESGWTFFYAMARQGLAQDLPGVLREPSAKWQAAWKAARSVNRVPALSEKTIDLLAQTLELLTRLQQLDPQQGGDNPLARVIASLTTPLPRTVGLDALQIVQEKGLEDPDALLELAKRHPQDSAAINSLVRGVRVHLLAPNDPGLFSKLSARLSDSTSDSIAPLAAMSSADWISVAKDTATSGGQALRLLAHLEAQHPIPALQAKIAAGTVTLPGVTAGEMAALIKNDGAKVEKIVQGKFPVKDADTGVSAIHKTLRDLGRFVRTGVSVELGADLMNAGIETPGKAIRYGREYIYEQYRERLPKEAAREITESFFDATELTVNGGKGALIGININRHWPTGLIPAGFEEYKLPLPDKVRENLPSLPGFFGDLDECICRPCESMLGQPAYLVDLLNLLGTNIHWLLKQKRSSIFTLPLDCENAEKIIQHIDIVLEVLAAATANLGRSASPAEIEQVADDKLAGAIYPWTLPFRFHYAEVTAYLAKLDVSRFDLLTLRSNPQANELAAETLGLSFPQQWALSEWRLLTVSRTDTGLWQAYGLDRLGISGSGFPLFDPASGEDISRASKEEVVTRASVLMDITGLDLDDLETVLATSFVSGIEGELKLSNRNHCKTSEMRVHAKGAGDVLRPVVALQGCLDRLHRFVRLRAKLPSWSIAQLDKAIDLCGGIEMEVLVTAQNRESLLFKLAIIKRLNDEHGLHLDDLLDRPIYAVNLRKSLGLSILQFDLLKAITAFDPAAIVQSFNFAALEDFCNAAQRIRESGLSIEQVGHALLTRSQLSNPLLLGELPPVIKTDEQIERMLKDVQQRLRSVVAIRTEVTPESQVTEALTVLYDAATAGKLVQAIRDAGATRPVAPTTAILNELVGKLSIATNTTHILGEWSPLMADVEARALLGVITTTQPTNLNANTRFQKLLNAIAARRRERELITVISEQCGLPETEVTALLGSRLLLDPPTQGQPAEFASAAFLGESFWADIPPAIVTIPPIPSTVPGVRLADMPRLHAWMDRLYRLKDLCLALKIDSALMLLSDPLVVNGISTPQIINWYDLLAATPTASQNAWTNPHWQALLDLAWLQQSEQLSHTTLGELLSRLAVLARTGVQTVTTWAVRPLATRLEITDAQALAIAAQAITLTTDNLLNPSKLLRAFKLLMLARRLGAIDTQVAQIADFADIVQAAATAKVLLEARVSEQAHKVAWQAVNDKLRQQRRDALVAYLVGNVRLAARGYQKFNNANDLYEYYLIDPQMEPCFDTTRILEAITSTQLFAQRLLFGLEIGQVASKELKDRWTWMRNYRVWEANRKVFLFPENWLFPELRDDKSSSFMMLESELGRGELTTEASDEAFGKFLDDVAQIGMLQVVGMYEDIARNLSKGLTRRDLYVIGRTANPPYAYFWRKCVDFGDRLMEWTPWQPIELDVTGDHVTPFVLNGVLNIAWLSIMNVADAKGAIKTVELTIAKSRLRGSTWEKPSISRTPVTIALVPYRDDRNGYSLRVSVKTINGNDCATVSCYVANSQLKSDAPGHTHKLAEGDLLALPAVLPSPVRLTIHKDNDTHRDTSGWPNEFGTPDCSAIRELSWECWIKLKAGTSGHGWMLLDSSLTQAHCVELLSTSGLRIPVNGNYTWIDLGDDSQRARLYGIGANGRVEESTWTVSAEFHGVDIVSLSSTASITCTRVSAGTRRSDHLIFNIDATRYTAEELGLDHVGQMSFQKAAEFHIDDSSEISSTKGHGNLFLPPNTKAYANGYLEVMSDTKPLFLEAVHDDGLFFGTQVFPATRLGRYFIVSANSNRDAWESPSVWHFKEGYGTAFIDFAPRRNRNTKEFRLLTGSFIEAQGFARNWRLRKSLPSAADQTALYGAQYIPPPGQFFLGDTFSTDVLNQEQLTFDQRLPNVGYAWEIFFHAPLLIADQLSKQHKFEDAERWLRYVFDPTSSERGIDPKRFLKFRVFKELKLNEQVIDDLTVLAQVAGGFGTASDDDAVKKLITRWRDSPFRPFLIARNPHRHIAFLWRTLFAYLDNLLAWADSLYRRDTRESINEATMLYVLAERILGRRPQLHQGTSKRDSVTYQEVMTKWDDFANYWIDVGTRGPNSRPTAWREKDSIKHPNPDGMLYFCMPFNDKILGYWNIVEARLSNVRNCRNIDGIKRSLPLMDAEIDPELLIRATAAGLDLRDVIAGLYAPPPHYRYNILSARAAELTSEAKSLGAAMLSAIEKRDAEHLAQLRSSNEVKLLKLVKDVRTLQISEAEGNIEVLRGSRKSIESRFRQYQRLLGIKDIKVPAEKESVGEVSMLGDVHLTSNRSSWGLIKEEDEQYTGFEGANTWSTAANIAKFVGSGLNVTASSLAAVPPDLFSKAAKVVGYAGAASSTMGDAFSMASQAWRTYADQQGMMAGHIRRRDEWAFQSNQTLKELQQIDKQILANQIRIDITQKELSNHIEQIEQAKAMDEVMRSKFTNQQLYEWMRTQLYSLYSSAYNMALEMARRAERAAARELGVKPLNILRNDYWNSLRDGLLAGERLHQDIKRLEVTYLDQNRREFELIKHISLRRLDPKALVNLRISQVETVNGKEKKYNNCIFDIPEWLFDLDTPGHYLRRIKSVSLSIPSVAGPYASINCKLTLLKSSVRHDKVPQTYLRSSTGDAQNFTDYFGASESVVTSTGSGDSGLFETQLRDERFLPFEGSGAISTWRLELPGEYPQFDYSTISDVVLTIRYTARDGGDSLRDAATAAIGTYLTSTSEQLRFQVLLSGRHDFPTEWASKGSGSFVIPIKSDLLSYWMEAAKLSVQGVRYADLPQDQAGEVQFLPATALVVQDASVTMLTVPRGKTDRLILLEVGSVRSS